MSANAYLNKVNVNTNINTCYHLIPTTTEPCLVRGRFFKAEDYNRRIAFVDLTKSLVFSQSESMGVLD